MLPSRSTLMRPIAISGARTWPPPDQPTAMLSKLLRNIRGEPARAAERKQSAGARQRSAEANALGRAALESGEYAVAIDHFRAAIAARDDNLEALANQGLCHAMLGHKDEAEQCLTEVLRRDPEGPLVAPVRMNLGNLASARNRYTAACRHYEAVLALTARDGAQDGGSADLLNNLGIALHRRGFAGQAVERHREALAARPDHMDAASNLLFALLHSPDARPEDMFAAFRAWAARFEAPLAPLRRPHANGRDPERRLRIGYVSGDFFKHAVSNFIEPVLRHHDRAAFTAVCYATRSQADEQTQVLRALACEWREVAALDDEALATRVREDQIDILVDLSSHTVGHRLLAFARKPAPVQITWLGYPATTGLDCMDYRISDAVSDPPGVAQALHSERLLYLPRTQWCYRPDPAAPPVRGLPALAAGRVTFGSFNNAAKLNDGVLRLWARVLAALPEARINVACVPDPESRRRIADTLIENGAAPAQVTVDGSLDAVEFWRVRDDIDIVLDAHPYNGTTTTCEALWAGLPVITLAGSHGAARSATAILTAAGLAELVAASEDDYVAIAARLAGDLPRLAQLRAGLRQRLVDSGFCDGARFTRELEELYRQAWRRWCGGTH
jgi:predicted O-linked N-acetylglucosamine transferase (SPINDLY family)